MVGHTMTSSGVCPPMTERVPFYDGTPPDAGGIDAESPVTRVWFVGANTATVAYRKIGESRRDNPNLAAG